MPIITEYLNTRKVADMNEILIQKEIDVVIDVRWSDWQPEYFRSAQLAHLCKINATEYWQYQTLGNPPTNRPSRANPQFDWKIAKPTYLTRLKTDCAVNRAFNDLLTRIAQKPTQDYCLICYCKTQDPNLCHRFWLQEYLETCLSEFLGEEEF